MAQATKVYELPQPNAEEMEPFVLTPPGCPLPGAFSENPEEPGRMSANEARRRKEVALARIREIELAEREGKLISRELVQDTWARLLASVRSGVLRIPDKTAQLAAATSDPREVRAILQRECEAALKAIHDELTYTPS